MEKACHPASFSVILFFVVEHHLIFLRSVRLSFGEEKAAAKRGLIG
jgi:hypothetical protein